ncbi:MAG TPA: adenosylcobinamide-GDP ribazoletransferase [Alphaproteobacteria bacterium]|nr:adenosylcobinamide-GDP ribazoletransferase [Alphaproteobacteria bacterium]
MPTDFLVALMLLTRLPVGRFVRGEPNLGRIVWAFPVIGLFAGALGGGVYWAGHLLGLSAWLSAGWAFGTVLVFTGAFHEDGLADLADGFAGGRTAERKLEIMRDSRIGSYGALGLAWSSFVRVAALAAIGMPRAVLAAWIVTAIIGRAGMILPLLILKPARSDGLAASMKRVPEWSATLGLALALTAPFLLLQPVAAIIVLICGLVTSLLMTGLARWQIGGHTGDVLGATEIAVECVVLTAMIALS